MISHKQIKYKTFGEGELYLYMHFMGFTKDFHVATVWLLCSYCVATVWLLCGYCVATMWLLCGYCVAAVLRIVDTYDETPSHCERK